MSQRAAVEADPELQKLFAQYCAQTMHSPHQEALERERALKTQLEAQNAAKSAGDGPPPSADSIEYWNEMYYERSAAWDTLYSYNDIRFAITSLVPEAERGNIKILHAGCGTSEVTEGLWRDGFRHIANFDFSPVVVEVMAERWKETAQNAATSEEEEERLSGCVQWFCADIQDLSMLRGGEYDLILEKFTLDALLCEAKDDATSNSGNAAVRELYRVLKPEGRFLSVAWGEGRREDLLRLGGQFDVKTERVPGQSKQRPLVYTCRKKGDERPTAQPKSASSARATPQPEQQQQQHQQLQQQQQEQQQQQQQQQHQQQNQHQHDPQQPQQKVGPMPTCTHDAQGVTLCFSESDGISRARDLEVEVASGLLRWRPAASSSSASEWREVELPREINQDNAFCSFTRQGHKGDSQRKRLELRVTMRET